MIYFACLDEFGHIGPCVSRADPRCRTSPVSGLAGFVLPAEEVRGFGTWFFQRKCQLLAFEIERSERHPALWEKKGSSLYTAANITRYPELRKFTGRMFNKIQGLGGFVFYVGIRKTALPDDHNPNRMHESVLKEAILRIDGLCANCNPPAKFALILDEHDQRSALVAAGAHSMHAPPSPRRHLVDLPFQVESHLYQTLQAADWIAGLMGRLGAYWVEPEAWGENELFHRYFRHRLNCVSRRSNIRT